MQSSERGDIQLDEGVLGEVKQRNLSAWREKVGEKENSGTMENGKPNQQVRGAFKTRTRSRHAKPTASCSWEGVHPRPPASGPTAIIGPLWASGSISRRFVNEFKNKF